MVFLKMGRIFHLLLRLHFAAPSPPLRPMVSPPPHRCQDLIVVFRRISRKFWRKLFAIAAEARLSSSSVSSQIFSKKDLSFHPIISLILISHNITGRTDFLSEIVIASYICLGMIWMISLFFEGGNEVRNPSGYYFARVYLALFVPFRGKYFL